MLLADGLPAESFLDLGNRGTFAGEAGARALHPDLSPSDIWTERACAPLLLAGDGVVAVRERLLARAFQLGAALTRDPALRVVAEGREVLVFAARPLVWQAMLPAGTRHLQLRSRHFEPAWFAPSGADRRPHGIAVRDLRLHGRRLPATAFGPGWHAAEPGWRWTDGSASLELPRLRRPAVLEIVASPGGCYWDVAPDVGKRSATG